MVLRHHRLISALFAVLIATTLSAAVPERERNALLAVYNSTNGPSWTDRTGWNGAAGTECRWFGVSCDDAESTVIALYLGNNALAGSIPAAISDLANLQELFLYENKLSGINPALGQLRNLRILDLNTSQAGGTIPSELGNLAQLVELNLAGNGLTASIPSTIYSLSNLEALDLDQNELTGSLSADIARLQKLQRLILWGNKLEGSIPPQITSLTALQRLELSINRFGGTIPADIGRLQNLVSLEIG